MIRDSVIQAWRSSSDNVNKFGAPRGVVDTQAAGGSAAIKAVANYSQVTGRPASDSGREVGFRGLQASFWTTFVFCRPSTGTRKNKQQQPDR
jgi:hypothetical protein